jgi:tRNA A37 threonylcarbamoyltransferase TsaD
MDISFSGLQTKIKELLDKKYPLEDISFSLQETFLQC